MKLNEIQSTASFAWSQDTIPILATGTAAGVIDDDFSSNSTLNFYNHDSKTSLASIDVDAKFHDLDWSKNNDLLAGALENGTIQFFSVPNGKVKDVKAVAKGEKHSGAIKSLQFNPVQHNVLASGGTNGEIYIWDTAKLSNLAPFVPGTAMTPMETVSSVAWNNVVPHIFASAGSSGYTSIWDLKSKKEVLHLTYTSPTGTRANLSTVAWHPSQGTKLITASEADGAPVLLTWDLRNSNAPEQIMEGHKKGILSLDWNSKDPSLLLSSGKDNTTMLWNPLTAQKLAQYPTTANWAFKTRFAPSAPDIFATSSFDKKVIVQTLQDTSPPITNKMSTTSENDFWNQISDTETQQPEYFVKQAPNWFGAHSSVCFGFGGKVVTVTKSGDKSSQVKVSKAKIPGSSDNEALRAALESRDFKSIVENRIKDSYENVNKSDWELLDKLSGESDIFAKFIALDINDKVEEGRSKSETKPNEDGEDFFQHLNEEKPKYLPSGEFHFAETESRDLINALLSKNLSKAVDISLKDDKLVEALMIALNGPQELKEKVSNHYFNKFGQKSSVARLLYSISSDNVVDLVENGDVKNWREIATAIKTYSQNPQMSKAQFVKLGDRILTADPVKNRDDAILNYINASALDKVSDIWAGELKALESKILESKKTSAYDAHFDSLTEFVEKFSAYRSILNLDAKVSDDTSSLSTILEYINIISTNGQFELASKFLSLLSDEVPAVKLEQERIAKATGTSTTSAAAAASTRRTATGRYGGLAATNGVTPSGTAPVAQAQRGYAPNANPYLSNAGGVPASVPAAPSNSYNGYSSQPQAPVSQSPYAQQTPLYGQPAANPYKPAGAAVPSNPYKPAGQTPMGGIQTPAAIPPPPKAPAKRSETEGWNDLPTTFHHKPRRSTPAAAVSVAPSPSNGPTPSGPPSISRTSSFVNPPVVPPPPRSVSKTSRTPVQQEVKPVQPQVNNRYAPPVQSPQPNISALNNLPSSNGMPSPQANAYAPPAPQSNPYAPGPGSNVSTPSANPYAPPQVANGAPISTPSNPYGPPPTGAAPISTPVNPYGPPAGASQPPANPYAPPAGAAQAQQQPQNPYGLPPQAAGAPSAVRGYAPPVGAQGQQNFGAPPKPMTAAASLQQQQQQIEQQPQAQSALQTAPATPEPKYPKGDRSHIPAEDKKIYEVLSTSFENAKAVLPEKFTRQVEDTEKRLNILYDHLNNEDLLSGKSLELLHQLVDAIEAKDFSTAMDLHLQFATNFTHEGGHWLIGIKRLIQFTEATA